MLQFKFDCREGNKGGTILGMPMTDDSKLKGGGNVETSIRNGKVFKPAWLDPDEPNLVATKAMLQAEYKTRSKRVEKLCINLSTSYGLVLGQFTDYL